MNTHVWRSGVSLIEVIVGISIIAVVAVAIGFSVTAYVDSRAALLTDLKAVYLAEEGYEIIRAIRDNDWNTLEALPVDTVSYLNISTSTFAISVTPEVIDAEYRRTFVLHTVYRNATDDIVASAPLGATIDNGMRKVEIFVSGPNGTTSLQAMLANLQAI